MRLKIGFALSILAAAAFAQSTRPVTLAGTGYRLPTNLVTGSPGQLMMISVTGIAPKPENPARPAPGVDGYPRQVNGLRVRLTQTESSDLEIVAMQQTPCPPAPTACVPVTSITMLLPRDLALPTRWFDIRGTLAIIDAGQVLAQFPFSARPDSVHILNSCDAALVSISIFHDVPEAASCLPAALQDGLLVNTNNPLRPGSGIALYLYGLGALKRSSDRFAAGETEQSFDIHFDYRPNATASRPLPGFSLTGKPFSSLGYPGGLYQMNFIVPPIPQGVIVPPCTSPGVQSNLTITISGLSSMDSMSFCVQP